MSSSNDEYRQQRAVEVFNSCTQLGRDLKVLRPTMKSACPHILANIIPRQFVEMGDALRRGCDQSEAVGANMKSTIHRRVARNKIDGKVRTYTRRDANGVIKKQWKQNALKCSRVMQAFRSECVRERILRDPESAIFLQRKHHRLIGKGRVSTVRGEKRDDAASSSIHDAYKKRVRELREEGGEPA